MQFVVLDEVFFPFLLNDFQAYLASLGKEKKKLATSAECTLLKVFHDNLPDKLLMIFLFVVVMY